MPVGLPAGAGRVLADRLRLAQARGPAEPAAPVHHHHRRRQPALPARPLPRAGGDPAAAAPRLARLGGGVPGAGRSADRPGRPRRRPGRRLPPGDPVPPRVRVLRPAGRARLELRPHRGGAGRADGPARLRSLRRPGWRRRRVRGPGGGPAGARPGRRRPRQRPGHLPLGRPGRAGRPHRGRAAAPGQDAALPGRDDGLQPHPGDPTADARLRRSPTPRRASWPGSSRSSRSGPTRRPSCPRTPSTATTC